MKQLDSLLEKGVESRVPNSEVLSTAEAGSDDGGLGEGGSGGELLGWVGEDERTIIGYRSCDERAAGDPWSTFFKELNYRSFDPTALELNSGDEG